MSDSASKIDTNSGEKTTVEPVVDGDKTAAPAIDTKAIAAEATEAALAILRAEQDKNGNHEDLTKKITELENDSKDRNKRLLAALSGEPEDTPAIPDLTKELLKDPTGVLSGVVEVAVNQATEKREAEAAFLRQQTAAAKEVIKERPDIAGNQGAQTMVELFLERALQANSELSPGDAMTEAVREYDLLAEKQGLGNKEDRIAAAGSISTSSSASMSDRTSKGGVVSLEDAAKVDEDWLKERRDADKKRRGLTS